MKRPHGAYGDKTATQRAVEHRSNAARYMASTLCMMASMNIYEDHSDWIKSLAADSTITGTAEMINVAPSTLTRYLKRNNNKLSADYIIRISLAYGKDPLLSLVKTGKVPRSTWTPNPRQLKRRNSSSARCSKPSTTNNPRPPGRGFYSALTSSARAAAVCGNRSSDSAASTRRQSPPHAASIRQSS